MDSHPDDAVAALVIRLTPAPAGHWLVTIDGTGPSASALLAPATFVVRLWRSGASGVLRGTIQLHGSALQAPFQTNQQIEALLRTWLDFTPETTQG